MTEIPDAEDTVVVNQSPAESVNTEDAVGSPSGRAVFRVEINGYNKLAPDPVNTIPVLVVTGSRISTAPKQNPVKNALLDYDSYTYSLSLHGCSITDYNNLGKHKLWPQGE